MTRFARTSRPPTALRQAYLAALAEPQEWFVEDLVGKGQAWAFGSLAYGVISQQTLVEFHVHDAHRDQAAQLFDDLRRQSGFDSVLAKSFDRPLLALAERVAATTTPTGYLFRSYTPVAPGQCAGFVLRPGSVSDLPRIEDMNDDFFDSPGEIAATQAAGDLWVLERGKTVVGCGVTTRVIAQMEAVDLGLMVAREHRRQGIGTVLMSLLAAQVAASGSRPICGCAPHNIASRRTLVRAGFTSHHRLVHCTLDPGGPGS